MVAVIRESIFADAMPASASSTAPIVVVGTGPAGARTVQELTRRMLDRPIVWCGAERCEPYNRVHLSSLLSGELSIDRFGSDYAIAPTAWLDRRLGCEIVSINRDAKYVVDSHGNKQSYSQLVLAIGSTPRIPPIPNVTLPGVYTFRNFADAEALYARLTRSRRTVVIGGGLLGLEAAKAMHRFNTEVTVLEGGPRLMMRQLDDAGAAVLKQHIEATGIEVRLGVGIRRIVGNEFVTAVELKDGETIDCDTIVVATGIAPNVELARRAGLSVGNGIHIDDETRTSDPYIHAVGECAEHRGVVYGLAAPGIEQATVAAGVIGGETITYDGTVTATRLKVVGVPVFSVGEITGIQLFDTQAWSFQSDDRRSFARLITRNGRLIGASAVGEIADVNSLQDAVAKEKLLWFWQRWNFARTGKVSSTTSADEVTLWPAATTVCNCMGVCRGQLTAAIESGCESVESIAAKTGASTICGSCKPLLAQLVSQCAGSEPSESPAAKSLYWVAGIAGVLSLLWLLPWSIPYGASTSASPIDVLWRDIFWKQVSGYSLLGASAIALTLSLRKRVKRFQAGEFGWWRVAHAGVGICTLLGFLAHTGGRLGSNLNFLISLSFLALTAVGAYASTIIAKEHVLGVAGIAMRRRMVWLHVVASWPLPTLLTFHVLKTYYF